jgi:glutamate dehydrogenase
MKLHVVLKVEDASVLDGEVLRIENKLRNITEMCEDRFIDNLYNTFGTAEDVFSLFAWRISALNKIRYPRSGKEF